MLLVVLLISGCGGGGDTAIVVINPPPTTVTRIFSDHLYDGDITDSLKVSQGNMNSVLAGIDPVTGEEYRAFLDFPLTGPGGVPGNAVIDSAILNIYIDRILNLPLSGSIPVRIDLVSFQPPTLVSSDFNRTWLETTTIIPPVSRSDINMQVPVDVTGLMRKAQNLGLADFQVRIMVDYGTGFIEINETTVPPLLEVAYYF